MSKKNQLGAPPAPQVDLLPPEVLEGRGFARLKRILLGVMVGSLVLAGGMYVYVVNEHSAAEEHLAEAQDTAAQLSREKAQYSEVTAVISAIRQAETARAFGMAPEIAWRPYIDAVAAVLPDDVSIVTIEVTNGSPLAPVVAATDPLGAPGAGSMLMVLNSPSVPVSSELVDAVEGIWGLQDPAIQTTAAIDLDGDPYYETTMTIQVGAEALAGRTFGAEEGAE